MLINLTNHPYKFWCKKQQQQAIQYGKVIDMPFPKIDPSADETKITNLANEFVEKFVLMRKEKNENLIIHIMGELTFCAALIPKLKKEGFTCIASTTSRDTEEENGYKLSKFNFVRFRTY